MGVAQRPRPFFSWLTNQNPGNRGNLRVIQALWYKTSSTDENSLGALPAGPQCAPTVLRKPFEFH